MSTFASDDGMLVQKLREIKVDYTKKFMCDPDNVELVDALIRHPSFLRKFMSVSWLWDSQRGFCNDPRPQQLWTQPHLHDIVFIALFSVKFGFPVLTVFEGNGVVAYLIRAMIEVIAELLETQPTELVATSLLSNDILEKAEKCKERATTDPLFALHPLQGEIDVENISAVDAIERANTTWGRNYILFASWMQSSVELSGGPKFVVCVHEDCTGQFVGNGLNVVFRERVNKTHISNNCDDARRYYLRHRFRYEDYSGELTNNPSWPSGVWHDYISFMTTEDENFSVRMISTQHDL
jgi:hypothetical protein